MSIIADKAIISFAMAQNMEISEIYFSIIERSITLVLGDELTKHRRTNNLIVVTCAFGAFWGMVVRVGRTCTCISRHMCTNRTRPFLREELRVHDPSGVLVPAEVILLVPPSSTPAARGT